MRDRCLRLLGLCVLKYAIAGLALVLSVLVTGAAEKPASEASDVKHVDPKQAQPLIAEKKVVVLDVRTPEEFKAGHIAGATNINFRAADFEKRVADLDKNKSYLVHCASGGRSTACLPALKKLKVESVYHLDGGINAWKKAGLPVEGVAPEGAPEKSK